MHRRRFRSVGGLCAPRAASKSSNDSVARGVPGPPFTRAISALPCSSALQRPPTPRLPPPCLRSPTPSPPNSTSGAKPRWRSPTARATNSSPRSCRPRATSTPTSATTRLCSVRRGPPQKRASFPTAAVSTCAAARGVGTITACRSRFGSGPTNMFSAPNASAPANPRSPRATCPSWKSAIGTRRPSYPKAPCRSPMCRPCAPRKSTASRRSPAPMLRSRKTAWSSPGFPSPRVPPAPSRSPSTIARR